MTNDFSLDDSPRSDKNDEDIVPGPLDPPSEADDSDDDDDFDDDDDDDVDGDTDDAEDDTSA